MVEGIQNQLLNLLKISSSCMILSHPLTFTCSFSANWQMQGQQSFSALRRYFAQLMSATGSAPFSLAAFSHSLMTK